MRSFRQFIQLMEGGEKAIFHKEPGKIGLSSPGWKETLAAGNETPWRRSFWSWS